MTERRKLTLPTFGLVSSGLALGAGFFASHVQESLRAVGALPEPGTVYRNLPEPPLAPGGGGLLPNISPGQAAKLLTKQLRPAGSNPAIPIVRAVLPARPGDLAATWFGHASVLLEIDGKRVLTDPVWSKRCSPTQLFGPARLHPPPLPLKHLPSLDLILLSHDHYDHLDMWTIRALAEHTDAPFVVPSGVGAHLRRWGVPDSRVVERGWWEEAVVEGLVLTCTPARHFSGRGFKRNTSLWASWSVAGPRHRVYFGGDSGYTRSFAEIAERVGRHDLTVLPIGAYNDLWREIHMNPQEAVQAHLALAKPGAPMLPIHWGTFRLAPHPWSEPIERLTQEAEQRPSLQVLAPVPGQRVDAIRPPASAERWWESVD